MSQITVSPAAGGENARNLTLRAKRLYDQYGNALEEVRE